MYSGKESGRRQKESPQGFPFSLWDMRIGMLQTDRVCRPGKNGLSRTSLSGRCCQWPEKGILNVLKMLIAAFVVR